MCNRTKVNGYIIVKIIQNSIIFIPDVGGRELEIPIKL